MESQLIIGSLLFGLVCQLIIFFLVIGVIL